MHNEWHENIECQFLIFQVAQQTRRHVIHTLAVADLRKNEGNGLKDVEELLGLLGREKVVGLERILRSL